MFDKSGGFYHYSRDDGSVYASTRHLVSSCRFVFNYAMAYREFGDPRYLEYARYPLQFLRDAHSNPPHQSYDWEIQWCDGKKRTLDGTRHCYGLAFVLLPYSHAAMAGIDEARAMIGATFVLMEHRFRDRAAGLYADEATADWDGAAPKYGGGLRKCISGSAVARNAPPPASSAHMTVTTQLKVEFDGVSVRSPSFTRPSYRDRFMFISVLIELIGMLIES